MYIDVLQIELSLDSYFTLKRKQQLKANDN